MTTELRFETQVSGMAFVQLNVPSGRIHVRTLRGAALSVVSVRVSTRDNVGPSADAVRGTRFEPGAVPDLAVTVPDVSRASSLVRRGERVYAAGGTTRVFSGGVTSVLGDREPASPIDVEVSVPEGAAVSVKTVSGDVRTSGTLYSLGVSSRSGDVTADRVSALAVETVSGDLLAHAVVDSVGFSSMSGSGRVMSYVGHFAELSSTSGDLLLCAPYAAGGPALLRTVSGDITLTGGLVGALTESISGRVKVR